MKDCYVGIDIGTTNTKAVILYTDGTLGTPLKAATPFYSRHGAVFFDLPLLENIVSGFKKEIQERCRIVGISFTSVGESVVPVRSGKALADPLFWNDPVTEAAARGNPIDHEACNPEMNRKGKTNATLSIYKIIWMRTVLRIDEPEYWLPIASYFIYRTVRVPCWDYSQATRTLLMDINAGKWESDLLRRFDMENQMPPINAMGTYIGEDAEGVSYALGGHDHITGLFCIETLVEKRPFMFDSIGSSESMVTLTNSRELRSHSGELCIGAAFCPGRFYALNAIIYSGVFLKFIAKLGGGDDVDAFFTAMNRKLSDLASPPEKVFPIIIGGDPVAGLNKSGLSFINIPLDTDMPQLAHAAYVYMAAMARLNIDELTYYTDPEALLIAGGGGTVNSLYLQYRAAILGRPIHIIPEVEMGGIGAALCAVKAMQDEKTARAFIRNRDFKVIRPDYQWGSHVHRQAEELLSFYRDMPEKKMREILS
jgi:sugar (pentulose or hexulose) kinase